LPKAIFYRLGLEGFKIMTKITFHHRIWAKIAVAVTAALAVTAQADDNDIRVFWKDSLRLESADGNNKFRLGGRIHWDNAFTSNDEYMSDGDIFRRTRLYVSGQIRERYDFKMQYDFANGSAAFKDVNFGITDLPVLGSIRIGQFKEPFSLEETSSSNDISAIERANVNRLVPSRSAGVMLYNDYADARVTSAVGLFRGEDDKWGNYEGDGYAATARVTGLPYLRDDKAQLVHLGVAYSHRSDDTAAYKLSSDHAMAPSTKHVIDGVDHTGLIGLEAALKLRSFSIQSEWVQAKVDAPGGGDLDGCYVQAGYVLTGEERSYNKETGAFKGISPGSSFLEAGGLGAWEATLRWSNLDYGELIGGDEVDSWTVGLNWYLNKNVRALFNYTGVDYEDGETASVFATRFQFAF
jgi:phosphate-selective porin OprO/OprP